MHGFALLFRRDLVQRIPLFIASFAMGLFIFAVPYLPGTHVSDAELRGAAGLVAALAWSAVLAILLGGSIFTRDLTENRLAFDFRLPVRPGAIWAARLFAAIVTIALAAALVLAPSALAGMDLASAAAGLDVLIGVGEGGQGLPAKTAITLAPLAVLALLLLANPVALASRARQAWAGVDMISFALIGFAGYWSWQTLRPWEAHSAIWWTTTVLVGATFVGTTVASLIQVVRGRTEADRAQSRLSLGLLGTALLAAGTVTGYSQWLVHPNLNDLVGNEATSQSLGPDWVVIQGPTRSHQQMVARFLLAPATGRVFLLGPLPQRMWDRRSVSSSLDGAFIAWLDSRGEGADGYNLLRLSTTDPHAKPEPTLVTVSRRTINQVLSPEGSSIAVLERLGGPDDPVRLVVSKIASGDVTAAVQLPSCSLFGDMLFVSTKEVVIPCGFPSYSDLQWDGTRLLRVDLATKETRTQHYQPEHPPQIDRSLGLIQTPHGWLGLIEKREEELTAGWGVLDSETGQTMATLELAEPSRNPDARGRQLRDGTFAITITNPAESRLLLYSARGELKRSIALPRDISRILAESADARAVLVATVGFNSQGPARESFSLVDLETGNTRPLGAGLHLQDWFGGVRSAQSVFYSTAGRLLWFNPQTKLLQPLLPDTRLLEAGLPTDSSS